MARKKKSISGLLITGIADKGRSVGRTAEGEVIFVDGAVPGDVVEALVLRKKKAVCEAVVTKITSYSKDRVVPPCNHFGVCGGCKWQHLDYQAQLKHKHQTVIDSITRIAKLSPDIVLPIIGCENNLFYRNKLEYSFSSRRWITKEEAAGDDVINQTGALGFHRPGAFDKIVDIHHCFLQDKLSDSIRNFVRDFGHTHEYAFYDIRNQEGLLRNMIVRNTTENEWMLIMIFGHDDQEKIVLLMESLKNAFPQLTSLNYVVNTKVNDTIFDQKIITYHGKEYIVEKLGNIKYKIGPKSFFQTNSIQAAKLFNLAVDFADLKVSDNVYDLYTGLGSIALYVASKVKHVTGIEEVPDAIKDALVNMSFNGITNATFYTGDVKDMLNDSFVATHGKPDVIITDPPRVGMHPDVIATLLSLEAPNLVYISCNPATQARDLALLHEKYETIAVQPVDMFPHTHHIASVAKLKLRT
ncbi:MAG: 23S rRNA (uracil(1939)-C(5))-methyltransferase RlmD [Saprospiraceae bacterium]|nr:23S rRNA (uracil(1939)-C(5))-methyltransferase RlmD [Saprospiraceae bacterium]